MTAVPSFGPLEKEVLDIVWDHGCSCSVRDIFCILETRRGLAYTTIMTVMNRLVEKGALQRVRQGKAHSYTALLSKQDVMQLQIQSFFSQLEKFEKDGLEALKKEFSHLPHKQKIAILKTLASEEDK